MSTRPDDIPQDVWDAAEKPYFRICLDIEAGQHWDIRPTIARAILAAKAEEREAIIQLCEAEKQAFRSPEYAANQPLGSLVERFAISECIAAIRKRGDENVSSVRKSENQEA